MGCSQMRASNPTTFVDMREPNTANVQTDNWTSFQREVKKRYEGKKALARTAAGSAPAKAAKLYVTGEELILPREGVTTDAVWTADWIC